MNSTRYRGLFVGLSTVDIVYPVDDLPPRNVKISVPSQQIAAGGPATNAAITFAFLGGTSALVSAVGSHPLSAVIRQDLDHFAVSLHDIAGEQSEAPPISSILVIRASGERTVVSANAAAFPALRVQCDPDWFEGVSLVLVDGHYMSLCTTVAEQARSRGIPVVLDSGSWKEGMAGLLRNVDIAICADDFRPPGCRDDRTVLDFLAGYGITRAAITRGAARICYLCDGTFGSIAVKQIQAVDTLGAGDIFHGAFCYWACQPGHSFVESLTFAAHVATQSCLHPGTRLWMETFPGVQTVRQYLEGIRQQSGDR